MKATLGSIMASFVIMTKGSHLERTELGGSNRYAINMKRQKGSFLTVGYYELDTRCWLSM